MITYGVACPHCKGAVKIEVAIEKARVLVSAVGPPSNGGGRVKPDITEEIPPRPAHWQPPSNGDNWPPEDHPADNGDSCPKHHRAQQSKWGGLYCPAPDGAGGYCKWRSRPRPAKV